jgi:hypothetical protein
VARQRVPKKEARAGGGGANTGGDEEGDSWRTAPKGVGVREGGTGDGRRNQLSRGGRRGLMASGRRDPIAR